MQRAGMLAIAVATASERRPIDLERASRNLDDVVRRKTTVAVAARESVATYLRSLRLWHRYPGRREGQPISNDDRFDIQDVWLADPTLPAATGAVTGEVIEDIPKVVASMKLVRDVNFTRNDRGKALLAALGEPWLKALTPGVDGVTEPNPLTVPRAAQLILLYSLLDADGDFLQAAYGTTTVPRDDFKRQDFASGLSTACIALAARSRATMRTGKERGLLLELERRAEEIAKPRKSGSEWGGGRPPDQMATLRLEPFVDFGVLTRLDRYAYRYRLDDGQRAFFDRLVAAETVDAFLHDGVVASWCVARGEERRRLSPEKAWPLIVNAYEKLRSPLGQASFVEVALLAIGQLLEADADSFFEVQDATDAMATIRKKAPKSVRLGVNRRGALTYMKLIRGRS